MQDTHAPMEKLGRIQSFKPGGGDRTDKWVNLYRRQKNYPRRSYSQSHRLPDQRTYCVSGQKDQTVLRAACLRTDSSWNLNPGTADSAILLRMAAKSLDLSPERRLFGPKLCRVQYGCCDLRKEKSQDIRYLRGHNEDSRVYTENKNVYGLLEVANKPTCMDAERNFIAKHRIARQPSNSW